MVRGPTDQCAARHRADRVAATFVWLRVSVRAARSRVDRRGDVALPLLLDRARRVPALRTARDWLDRLGLDGLGQRRSGELSGGQAQRVALARGLIGKPRV